MTLWLPEATTTAPEIDYLILAMLMISVAVLALVFGLMLLYVIKYRAGSGVDRGALAQKTWRLETVWTIATLVAFLDSSSGERISICASSNRRPTR